MNSDLSRVPSHQTDHPRRRTSDVVQAYLDAIEAKTGRTPQQLLDEAADRGYTGDTKASEVLVAEGAEPRSHNVNPQAAG